MRSLARRGAILSVCTSPGGIPKRRVAEELAGPAGLSQDGHKHAKHNHPRRAVLLLDEEIVDELRGEGYSIEHGAMGENLTVRGLRAQNLPPGTRLRCEPDGPLLETTERRKPCYVLDQIDPQLKSAVTQRGGMFTRVLTPGAVRPGQTIGVVAAPLRAGILIGGQSRRMGAAKHLLRCASGETLLERTWAVAAPLVMDAQLLGSGVIDLPPATETLLRVPDADGGGGPLAGLAAALRLVQSDFGPDGGWLLLLACDLPRLERAPLDRLWQALEGGLTDEFDAAVFSGEEPGQSHACAAFYHSRILDAALSELATGRSLQRLLSAVRTRTLMPAAADTAALQDADTPAEMATLGVSGKRSPAAG